MATKQDRFPLKYFNAKAVKDNPQILVIEQEQLEDITDFKTGKTNSKSVLSFQHTPTRLILNGETWDQLCVVTGETDTARWPGHEIEFFCDQTDLNGALIDCVRIRKPTLVSAAAAFCDPTLAEQPQPASQPTPQPAPANPYAKSHNTHPRAALPRINVQPGRQKPPQR